MSLITQCPACTTLFKVVPDQLRISDGWVRCGQCDEVFDANANIRGDVPVMEGNLSHKAVVGDAPNEAGSSQVAAAEVAEAPEPLDIPLDVELTSAEAEHFLDKSPKELLEFSAAVSAASTNDALLSDAKVTTDSAPERRYMQMFAPASDAQADPKLSFMKPVRAPSIWARRWMRIALGLAVVLLALLALLQVTVIERDRLAAQYPDFRGELAGLCTILGCEVKALRQIESVVIDSSAFSKVRNDVYKLSFTLRNTSAIALATPSMELTLTDMQDQILMRKVLMPNDFAAIPTVMNAGVEVGATLPVSVRSPVPAERVSGYRLLAFYP